MSNFKMFYFKSETSEILNMNKFFLLLSDIHCFSETPESKVGEFQFLNAECCCHVTLERAVRGDNVPVFIYLYIYIIFG